jgi:pentatricopeptide repeat protein
MTMEEEDGIELSVDERGNALYIPKVLCLLSAWPYLTAFREYLAQLYRLATATNVMRVPIERYVVNLCHEIPAPPPGAYEVQVSILDSTIRFWAPPAKLPIAYVALPYRILFECLDLEHILTLWKAMIVERKILLVSSQYSILTVCAEILCSLLFPMRWSHLYVPLLPRMFCPVLDAPVPFLCGVVRENWLHAQEFLCADSIVVDLDHNTVTFGPDVPIIPPPPAKKWNKLNSSLTELVADVFWRARGMEEDFQKLKNLPQKRSTEKLRQQAGKGTSQQWNERLSSLDNAFSLAYTPDSPNLLNDRLPETEQAKWASVQEAFHQFFVAALKDYRKFLTPADEDTKPSFDSIAFLAYQKSINVPFVSEMVMTQQFDDFLTRRMYSPGEPELVFFDQSIDAKKNRSKLKIKKVDTHFLQSASTHKDLKKFPAVAPNAIGLPGFKSYVYKRWPDTFDERLFSRPRPIPKMITCEFDRQAYLVSKLRPTIVSEEDDGKMDGGDYDTSPEVGAFTVFFFVYSALVGRDWQKYSQKRQEEQKKRNMSTLRFQEDREGVGEVIETVLPGKEADAFVADLSLGVCDSCPNQGVMRLRSTLIYIGQEAEESYKSFFQKTVEDEHKLQRTITAHDEKSLLKQESNNTAVAAYEEAKEVATAQLDLAFEALATVSLRGLSADSDSYLSLMEACGRCGDTQRAVELMQLMKKDGFAADSEVLASFLTAFARSGEVIVDTGDASTEKIIERGPAHTRSGSDAYSRFLEKQFDTVKNEKDDAPVRSEASDASSEFADDDSSSHNSGCSTTNPTGGGTFQDWFIYHRPPHVKKKDRRRRRRKKNATASKMPDTDMLSRQLALGEILLDFVFPNLSIGTNSDSCPHCSYVLCESDVVKGWAACAFQDYTTNCPQCQHRFVPQFIVSCSSPNFVGSQGIGTPLYCEFLSPWVVRKELQSVVKGETGVEGMLKPEWRGETGLSATLFWNLMVLFRRYRLPFAFLLQGSFQNRLILPRKPDET